MEILCYALTVFGFMLLSLKLYWDKRMVENKLYISEHVFFESNNNEEPVATPKKGKK